MSSHNAYAQYKRDTRHLLYWIINTSNAIIERSGPSLPPGRAPPASGTSHSRAVLQRNTTGQTTVAGFLDMSHCIATNLATIPHTIFRLFQSVIEARSRASTAFEQMAETGGDSDMRTSNEKHKHFIRALREAFQVLGGEKWLEEMKDNKMKSRGSNEEEEFANVIFANKFASLNLDAAAASETSDDEENAQMASTPNSSKPTQSFHERAQSKKKNKSRSKQRCHEAKLANLDDVPLESYRIIEEHEAGNDSLMTDYLLATDYLFNQMGAHRGHVQLLWQEVAYHRLNSAVAAGVSDSAVSMVRETVSEIFLESPGHETYETCMRTITRGDPSKVDGMVKLALLKHDGNPTHARSHQESFVDVYEHLQVHTFEALRDFLLDFKKNHTGKPTKRMAAEIANWDPDRNLQAISKEDRIRWRRQLTINWLYDFVNQWSLAGFMADHKTGRKHDFNTADWTSSGPWGGHRRMFGARMSSFAGTMATFAWQPMSVNVESLILPQHVFQLTCIIDSLAVARGWLNHPLQGEILQAPANNFSPKRDIVLFLEREYMRQGHGWIMGVENIKRGLQCVEKINRQVGIYETLADMLDEITGDFINFLGEAKDVHGGKYLPPSRFVVSCPEGDGLSIYSPYFCGDGLLEALTIAFHCGMKLWDSTPEPYLAVHLHNMLVETGDPPYTKQVNGLWGMCEGLFTEEIFGGVEVPEKDHYNVFMNTLNGSHNKFKYCSMGRRNALVKKVKNAKTVYERLDSNPIQVFHTKSFTTALIKADFNVDRVPNDDIRWKTSMGLIRLDEVKVVTDPETGKLKLEDTEMVIRARRWGMSDDSFIESKLKYGPVLGTDEPMTAWQSLPAEVGPVNTPPVQLNIRQYARRTQYDESNILDALKSDLHGEICGWKAPYLGINYLWA